MNRVPIIPTIIVALAVAAMIKLGVWQLDRLQEKEALLTRYAAAANLPAMAFPAVPVGDQYLFRKASGYCLEPVSTRVEAGRNQGGASGWRHIASCKTGAEGPGLVVDIGWSTAYDTKSDWRGGQVSGMISSQPDHRTLIGRALGHGSPPGLLLIADTAASGLMPSATPKLEDIPNNHLAYAWQWFIFAGLAALIYGIALRRRLKL